jgi:hypothetical protein
MRIELLHVPGCANVDRARQLLRTTLGELGLEVQIEELEGEYPSPTILIDGVDVMGRPEAEGASCRLDLPTRERLLVALQRSPEVGG